MKTKILILTMCVLAVFTFANCENDSNNGKQKNNPLIGVWVETFPCNACNNVFTITENEIRQQYPWDETPNISTYEWVTENSIRVTRLWTDIACEKITTNTVVVHSDGSITIEKFYISDEDVYPSGFTDVTLIRKED